MFIEVKPNSSTLHAVLWRFNKSLQMRFQNHNKCHLCTVADEHMEVKTDMAWHTQSFIRSPLYSDEKLVTSKPLIDILDIYIFLIQSRQKVQMSLQGKKKSFRIQKMILFSWFKRQCLVLGLSHMNWIIVEGQVVFFNIWRCQFLLEVKSGGRGGSSSW